MISKSILITCFDRFDSLKKCIKHLYLANNIDEYHVVFVRQKGNLKVKKIIECSKFKNKYIINTNYPDYYSPLKKMANNGYIGWKFCFEKLKSDYSIYLEDDILVSYDFLNFHNFIHQKYKDDKNFFGVNGFSGEKFDESKISKYSKFIFGLGKGFSTNKYNWTYFKKNIWNKSFLKTEYPTLDSANQQYAEKKKLYVVMPICSRILEYPTNGLHIKKNDTYYFNRLKKSFVKIKYKKNIYDYSFLESYSWRKDCKKYKGQIIETLNKFFKNFYYSMKRYLPLR
jgi:hypothetical protein